MKTARKSKIFISFLPSVFQNQTLSRYGSLLKLSPNYHPGNFHPFFHLPPIFFFILSTSKIKCLTYRLNRFLILYNEKNHGDTPASQTWRMKFLKSQIPSSDDALFLIFRKGGKATIIFRNYFFERLYKLFKKKKKKEGKCWKKLFLKWSRKKPSSRNY